MGVADARRDGIKYRDEFDGYRRVTYYTVKCNTCGKEFEYIRYNSNHASKYKCKSCKEQEKLLNDTTLYATKEARFERAVARIEKQVKKFADYQKAIEVVHKNLHRKGFFNSTEEIMAAIELVKNKVKIIHQQRIKNYHVDFVLPDKKVILEIDGRPFHNDIRRQGIRDGEILLAIGISWHMVRIDTDLINKDVTKLLYAIDRIVELQNSK